MTTALIVEDNPELLPLLEERLLSMGHQCQIAHSQSEAEEILTTLVFDYILLDLEIPNRSSSQPAVVYGQNLLRKIRQAPGHVRTPVLVITGHGLDSHRLSVETMKLGATDFIGKPFGLENPLEDRIREALREMVKKDHDGTPGKLRKFNGDDLIFYDDRVELCGIKVCGPKNLSIKRRVLDLLCEQTPAGAYRCFSMKQIADRLNLDRVGAVAEAIADFRNECRAHLRTEGAVDCEAEDVVCNQNRGYHLRNWIKVLRGTEDTASPTSNDDPALSEFQKAIIRYLRTHATGTPRQLSEALGITTLAVTREVAGLLKTCLVIGEGNGSARKLKLPKAASDELTPPLGT